jgi:choline dehydrogenase-like flavoprotein
VANRLTADGRYSVLLLEAGGRDNNLNIHIPLMVANILNDERVTWPYMTEPQMHLNGQKQKWVRGRVIGGSSSVNGNLFVRGDPAEYDSWADKAAKAGATRICCRYSSASSIFRRVIPRCAAAAVRFTAPVSIDLIHYRTLFSARAPKRVTSG